MIFCSCKTHNKLIDSNSFTYFTRQSNFDLEYGKKNQENWVEFENDTVILTKYFKGSDCDLPIPQRMSINIVNDTLAFDFGRIYDPNCERQIGSALILVDFVLNKRKYPNYKKLIIKYKYDNPNWRK